MGYTMYKNAAGPVLGVLFDMDGVIVDTEKLYARFWAEAARELGYPMTYAQALGMRSLNRQAGQAKLESYFGPGIDIHQVRAIRMERMERYIDAHGVEWKPGIWELLDALQEKGIPAAITTSSPQERVKKYLEPLGLYHRFARICTGYEVAKGKPEPDIYLYGAECLGVAPENCLAIEDSPAGIESAWRAGCMAVLVPDLDGSDETMRKMLFAEAESLRDIMDLLQRSAEDADRKLADALLNCLPDRRYSPAVLVGEAKIIDSMVQNFFHRMEAEKVRVLVRDGTDSDEIDKADNCVLIFKNIQNYQEDFSAQETFIDVFDVAAKRNNTILVTSDREIHKLNVEERMKARLLSGVVAQIGDK